MKIQYKVEPKVGCRLKKIYYASISYKKKLYSQPKIRMVYIIGRSRYLFGYMKISGYTVINDYKYYCNIILTYE